MGKGIVSKVIRYFKKNGFMDTMYAAVERVFFAYHKNYDYIPPSEEKLAFQRDFLFEEKLVFSIVVPTYETEEAYLREMIESVLNQTYPYLELVLADASSTDKVKNVVSTYQDNRMVYKKLEKNAGISDNTNEGILLAKGDYIALLDHDDFLTPDALFEVRNAIEEEKKEGKLAKVLFSDEDKCNSDATSFNTPHYKGGFNKALLRTNNYICHLFVCKSELAKALLLRKEFDGAQDYDFILRATDAVEKEQKAGQNVSICHVPKILYHWRCHENSTAQNPESKMYAYDAGKRALEAYYQTTGKKVQVEHSKHLGFYRIQSQSKQEILESFPEAGCIGGAVYKGNKIVGGAMDSQGTVIYNGLHKKFEGYMNRARLLQNAYAVDIRNMCVRKEFQKEKEEILNKLSENSKPDYKKASLEFCEKIKKQGYEILYWER